MMNAYSLAADLLHLIGMLNLPYKILTTRSCAGISGRSQILFTLVFTTRYFDLFINFVSLYNSILKVVFLLICYGMLYLMWFKFKATYGWSQDAFSIEIPIILSAFLAFYFNYNSMEGTNFDVIMKILWTFSIFLESMAILPQMSMLIKIGTIELFMKQYLMLLGLYRALYILSWFYRCTYEDNYFDPISIVGGVVQMSIYAIFCIIQIVKKWKIRLNSKTSRIHDSQNIFLQNLTFPSIAAKSENPEEVPIFSVEMCTTLPKVDNFYTKLLKTPGKDCEINDNKTKVTL